MIRNVRRNLVGDWLASLELVLGVAANGVGIRSQTLWNEILGTR
jgi:hypothetical protein